MKIYALFLLPLIYFLTGCNSGTSNVSENKIYKVKNVTDSYQAHKFTEDQRSEILLKIKPEIQDLIEEHIQERHIPGVAWGLVVDDELLLSGAAGVINIEENLPASVTSCFRIASMSKSFTAMAIMKLRDEGKLSLDDPVEKYIPEMENPEYLTSDSPLIDIENLLTMTAGFPEDNPWGDRQLDEPNQMLTDLLNVGISFSNPPYYTYEYSNTGYALLGLIITRVSGKPYQSYIRENILKPLEMKDTYWEFDSIPDDQLALGYRWEEDQWKPEPILHDGAYGAMGGLITTIEDFSRYVSFHLSAWPPRSEPDTGPVKRSTLREMHTPQFSRLYAEARDINGDTCPIISGYGYGLGIRENCMGILQVSHGGALPGYGSNYVFYPEYGIGLMAFGNLTYTSPWPLEKIKVLLFENTEIKPRQLPVSDILAERQDQVLALIHDWDTELEKRILAENFYLDKSRENRMADIREVLNKAGKFINVGTIEPYNQLRGRFSIEAENGLIYVFFTLTPEKDPRVQYLDVWLENDSVEE